MADTSIRFASDGGFDLAPTKHRRTVIQAASPELMNKSESTRRAAGCPSRLGAQGAAFQTLLGIGSRLPPTTYDEIKDGLNVSAE